MKRRLSFLLALAMVLSLVFSSMVMATPDSKKISNDLELEVIVEGYTTEDDALKAINDYLRSVDYGTINKEGVDELEDALKILELYSDDYKALAPDDGPERHTAVFRDLWRNRPKVDGQYQDYTVDELKEIFPAIVETRTVTQVTMNLVNGAEGPEGLYLDGKLYVEVLLNRFQVAKEIYKYHSSHTLEDKVNELQGLMDRYNALKAEHQTLVLAKVLEIRDNIEGNAFVRSEHTTDAFKAALDEIEKTKQPPTIFVNDLAKSTAVGLYDNFTVGTTTGDYEGEPVRVKIEVEPSTSTGFELEYVEQNPENENYKKYLPLTITDDGVGWFGPSTGFPLSDVSDSMFRVTWKEVGEYKFTLTIMAQDEEGQFTKELASITEEVTVSDIAPVMNLAHVTDTAGKYSGYGEDQLNEFMAAIMQIDNFNYDKLTENINEGDEFDYIVAAQLDDVDHVDNILFIFEVEKDDGKEISEGDFEVIKVSLRDDDDGINNTFKVGEDGKLRGYWGPKEGFYFEGTAATAFKVKFNNDGKYTVKTYAIQVEKAEEANL